MAATDKNYRNQKTLDIVFAVSCILMLVSVVWMFVQDFNRPWKSVQREFRNVETALAQREMLDQLPELEQVLYVQEDLEKKRKTYEAVQEKLAAARAQLQADHDKLTAQYQAYKADYDSLASYINIDREHYGEAEGSRKEALAKIIEDKTAQLSQLAQSIDSTQRALDDKEAEIKRKIDDTTEMKKARVEFTQAEEAMKKVSNKFDLFAKVASQKSWKIGDAIRALPIIDFANSPTRIHQITLPDLTIPYGSFKQVPRMDRCMTCHLAADQPRYHPDALAALGHAPSTMQRKLKVAHALFKKRLDAGESLGFDLDDLPKEVQTVKLTRGQIMQFKAHPRLDLFVGANSPHPSEDFGCTICHSGQGSATDFTLASHAPNSAPQEHHWEEDYSWKSNHYWDFPMLPSRFAESSCLKCHHEVTDLIQYGSREEAPKVLEGYNIVKDVGCFGCHEINGTKEDRRIGPDLRLEPSPALSWLPPAEQEAIRSDKQNPPGTLRKVGPSLRRMAEKTNEKWTRQWLNNPRGFRHDTKMPHFWNLSTNSPETLPEGQKGFPAVEIHSIAHYLIQESKNHLDGKDNYREALRGEIKKLHEGLAPNRELLTALPENKWKALVKATKNLRDLGLMSNPKNNHTVNDAYAAVVQAQEVLQEFLKNIDTVRIRAVRTGNADGAKSDIEEIAKALAQPWTELGLATKLLVDAGMPVPISKGLIDHTGATVTLPEVDAKDEKHLTEGRKLFQERGCLACHKHEGTEKEGNGLPAVTSGAVFGPNLSAIASKIAPEGDAKARRAWLTQWLLDPTVHHPRTRMPVTYLEVNEALAVADWLLSVGPQNFDGTDPAKPDAKTIRQLARIHLKRTPGMTLGMVDKYLPEGEGEVGIPAEKMAHLPADAEERKLQSPINPDELESRLLWYIGKKTVGRMGCFACHDVSGFAGAKPIGTPLADWGQKDPARLAFEDIKNYLDSHYNIVPARMTREDIEARLEELTGRERRAKAFSEDAEFNGEARYQLQQLESMGPLSDEEKKEVAELRQLLAENPWQSKDGKEPYEAFYSEALHHHHREGFLEQKLRAPRSYDYGRDRNWDDRLRMPQFKFARRVPREEGEEDAAYEARKSKVEAEKREALMTFILGLVGEEVPLKYVYTPEPAKKAEIEGRKVLDTFNCGGCHQIRAGVFELKKTAKSIQYLTESYDSQTLPSLKTDYFYPGHDAWTAHAQSGDTLLFHGTQPRVDTEEVSQDLDHLLLIRLTEGAQFTDNNGIPRTMRAKDLARLLNRDVVSRADPFGGTYAQLLVDYLKTTRSDIDNDDKARNLLPPPLIREGERVQPSWLYRFLLEPYRIRPLVVLRMPRFAMSNEESQALVDYFTAVEKLQHPGGGADSAYADVPQKDEGFWKSKTAAYVAKLGNEEVTKRLEAMKPTFEIILQAEVDELNSKVSVAKASLAAAKEDQKAPIQKTVDSLEKELQAAKDALSKKDFSALSKRWKEQDAYAADAYRLLTTHVNGVCLTCHKAGDLGLAQAPPLDKLSDRLNPGWTMRWISHPQRLFGYDTVMPVNFPRGDPQSQELFKGTSREQIAAIRDVLMNYRDVADSPFNRYYKVAPTTTPTP